MPGRSNKQLPSVTEIESVLLGNNPSSTERSYAKRKAEEILKMPAGERERWIGPGGLLNLKGFDESSHENVKEVGPKQALEGTGNAILEALSSFMAGYGIRALEVIGGALLIIFGLTTIAKKGNTSLPKVVPV